MAEEKYSVDDLVVIPAGEGGVDFTEYEGSRVPIENIELKEVTTDWDTDRKFKPGLQRKTWVARITTAPVLTLKNKEGKEFPIRASELINLKVKDGKIGFSDNPKSKVQKLFAKYKIRSLKELKGKTATITIREKNNKQFFGIVVA